MENLIYEIMIIVATTAVAYVGAFAKQWLETHTEIAGYEFDNDRVERILANAIAYLNASIENTVASEARKLSQSDKLNKARVYVDMVDPELITKYGKELNVMLIRKAKQLGSSI